MMKVGKMRRLWELRRIDFGLAMIALVGVLVMPTLEALALAVVVSLGVLIWRASEGRMTFLGRAGGSLEPVDLRTEPAAAIPGLLIVRPDEMLFFANVASVRDGIVEAVADMEPRATVVLLDLSLTPEVDVPVAEALEDLHGRLAADGIELWLAGLRPVARDLLERAGTLAKIGAPAIHPRVLDGILSFALRMPDAGERVAVLEDLLAFIRERLLQPGTSAAGVQTLQALEGRLTAELAAASGTGGQAPAG
jgi:SulP family sulfate permease